MKLSETEVETISIKPKWIQSNNSQEQFCLLAKLLTDRAFNEEALQHTLRLIWKPHHKLIVKDVGVNLMAFSFLAKEDRDKVLHQGPWTFDKHLVLVQEFDGLPPPSSIIFSYANFWVQAFNLPMLSMNEEIGEKIGNAIGKKVDMDISEDGLR